MQRCSKGKLCDGLCDDTNVMKDWCCMEGGRGILARVIKKLYDMNGIIRRYLTIKKR